MKKNRTNLWNNLILGFCCREAMKHMKLGGKAMKQVKLVDRARLKNLMSPFYSAV
jgi:hypothetical protein